MSGKRPTPWIWSAWQGRTLSTTPFPASVRMARRSDLARGDRKSVGLGVTGVQTCALPIYERKTPNPMDLVCLAGADAFHNAVSGQCPDGQTLGTRARATSPPGGHPAG